MNTTLSEWSRMSVEERGVVLHEFGRRQIKQYSTGVGWFFWCWKVDVGNSDQPWWSMKECIANGWLCREDWANPND